MRVLSFSNHVFNEIESLAVYHTGRGQAQSR